MSPASLCSRIAFVGLGWSALLFAMPLGAQTERVDLYVHDARPVAQALLELTKQYPTIVTYEDPRYVYAGDILDVTESVRRAPGNGGIRTLVPRGGLLQISYEVMPDSLRPVNFANTLASILEVNNLSPVGGRFDVRRDGDVFHVVPSEARDREGRWVKQTSILDTPISLSTDEDNGYRLTEEILEKVSEASGATIGLAVERFANTFIRYRGSVYAQNEPARDVLMRTLSAMSERFTYHLLYDPSGKYYVLGAHLAAEPAAREVPLDLSVIPRPGDPTPAGPPFQVRPNE